MGKQNEERKQKNSGRKFTIVRISVKEKSPPGTNMTVMSMMMMMMMTITMSTQISLS